MPIAIIDLGTNTFQLLIAQIHEKTFKVLHEESKAAKIGKGGISDGFISEEAVERALLILKKYQETAQSFEITPAEIIAIATSAVRNANNKEEFCQRVLQETGISIQVIDGEREAHLIYEGVKLSTPIGKNPAMIMDIGGGSVEFIIGNEDRIFWKQSFEIGGQRLMDKFMTTDPISPKSIMSLYAYLEQQLLPLTNAVHQYAPETLIGSAGSFETLIDIFYQKSKNRFPSPEEVTFDLPKAAFYDAFQQIMTKNRAERMVIKGMIELRVEMIVVGVCLIDFVLKKYEIEAIKVSNYALKEGVLNGKLRTEN